MNFISQLFFNIINKNAGIKVKKDKRFIKEFVVFPFKKKSWDSQIRIVEWFKQILAIAWVLYLLFSIEQVQALLQPIYKLIRGIPFIDFVIEYYRELLLSFSVLYVVSKLNYFCIVKYRKKKYHKLDDSKYPEYSLPAFSFQENIVDFLNQSPKFGDNLYWLNGSWGSGKTHFIRTFFQHQSLKIDEIYYVSCFGIKTREQAEVILVREIENRSTFGNLDFIPVVGGLFKWFYKIVGLDLIKKNSVIIFDDLERVSFVEKLNSDKEKVLFQDNPADYNDILGFIDYLTNHKNQKMIVIFNNDDIPKTYEQILKPKCQPAVNPFPSQIEIVTKIIEEYQLDDKDFKQILISFYQNIVLQRENFNFRSLKTDLNSIRKKSNEKDEILKIFNNYTDIWKQLFGDYAQYTFNFHYYVLFKNDNDKNKTKLKELSVCMWKSNIDDLKNLVWYSPRLMFDYKNLNKSTEKYSHSFPKYTEILVGIYYDIQNGNLKENYKCNDVKELTDDVDILIHNFPPTVKINNIELSKHVLNYIKQEPSESRYISHLANNSNKWSEIFKKDSV